MTESLMINLKTAASGLRAPRGWPARARLLAGLAAVLAAALNLPAQTGVAPASASAVPAPIVSSNRFLFVVDTSAGMKRHLADVVNVAQDIIRSGANGQLHNGDTIGVWTFNETIYTGNLPLQEWVPEDSEEIALRMTEFFRQQRFEKKSNLDAAMLGLFEIVKHSDILTVFIISDGSGRMQGTPFDQQINASYQQNLQEMKKDRRPIVTVLQTKSGRLIRYTVNAVPWPVVIPEVPIPIRLAGVPPAGPAPAAAQTVATTATVTPESKPAPATTAVVPPQTPAATPPVASAPTQPLPQPSVVAPTPTPATPKVLPPQIPPMTTPTAISRAPVAPGPNPAGTATTPALPAPMTRGPFAAKPPTNGLPAFQPGVMPAVLPKPAAATNQVMAQKTPSAASAPKPAQVSESNPKPATISKTVPPATAGTNAAPAPAQPKTSLIAQGTALVKSFAGEHPRILLIGGGALIVIGLGLIVVLVRRSRRTARISLISQTLDQ